MTYRGWQCEACGERGLLDFTTQLTWLRKIGMLRRAKDPSPELAQELIASAAGRLPCPTCGETQIRLTQDVPGDDEESFPEARLCEGCRRPIPAERLEALPTATLCAACQGKEDRGDGADERTFCPRCGSEMALRRASAGITRYQLVCPACRKVGDRGTG